MSAAQEASREEADALAVAGLTATDESVLRVLLERSVDSLDVALRGADLVSALDLAPEDLNDTVTILEDAGYVETHNWLGTAPFTFAEAHPTSEAFVAGRKYLTYDPEKDMLETALAVVKLGRADGRSLSDATALSAARVSRAVRCLEARVPVKVRRAIGTAPYDFAYVEATPQLRRALSGSGGNKE